MQFTVLIEFLVPGLATTLLALALLPGAEGQLTPKALPASETLSALILLAISYPVGILTNFAAFLVQRKLLTPRLQRGILADYVKRGIDLLKLAHQRVGFTFNVDPGKPADVREFFNLLRAIVGVANVERLNAVVVFQEGLQRFARGMLLPLLLASVLVFVERIQGRWVLLVVFAGFFFLAALLLKYSVSNEEGHVVRYFVTLTSTEAGQLQRPRQHGNPRGSDADSATSSSL